MLGHVAALFNPWNRCPAFPVAAPRTAQPLPLPPRHGKVLSPRGFCLRFLRANDAEHLLVFNSLPKDMFVDLEREKGAEREGVSVREKQQLVASRTCPDQDWNPPTSGPRDDAPAR